MKKKIIIMAGGTLGHISPGLEIAKSLQKNGWKIFWIGCANTMEAKIIPKYNIPINFINTTGVRGKSFLNLITIPIKIIRACYQAQIIIKKINPDVILGMGNYISVPGGIISYLYNKPLIIHEQNRVLGLANKLLSKFATINMQAFPNTIRIKKNSITVGNPIRKSINDLKFSYKRFKNRLGPLKILVIGGSQGAEIFNFTFPKVVKVLKNKIILWHQVGNTNIKIMKKIYEKMINYNIYKVTPFIKDISKAYYWADLIICRSGALTVSEIQHVCLPAIFVPYPHKDKHQYWNALPLKTAKGAKIIMQSNFNADIIISILKNLDRKTLIKMSKNLSTNYKINSTQKITQIIEKLVL